ncbi:MAG: STAS domain-containing protein [Leptospiraceae bacterium]|nr:STAS domain-containing protein [Leptospiraceae bacterium]
MSYTHRVVSGVDVIELEDAIDLYSTPPIKKFLKTLIKDENKKIVISLEKVNFLDSSGLGMLVNLFFECRERKIRIKLAKVSLAAMNILRQSKTEGNFEIVSSVEYAIESF